MVKPSRMDVDRDGGEEYPPMPPPRYPQYTPMPSPRSPSTPSPRPTAWGLLPPQAKSAASTSPARQWSDIMESPVRVPDSKLHAEFINFVESYTQPGGKSHEYQSQLQNLSTGGTLQINFMHLLQVLAQHLRRVRERKVLAPDSDPMEEDSNLMDLVLRIGNDAKNEWLNPALNNLLQKYRPQESIESANIKIVNKPGRIDKLKDFISDKSQPPAKMVSVLAGRDTVCAATTRGRVGFRAPLSKLISHFRADQWFEDLNIEHFLVINMEHIYILKTPHSRTNLVHLSQNDARTRMVTAKGKNLKTMWEFMKPFYMINGILPIYFGELGSDMQNALVDQEWFLRYLEMHYAFTSSMCRKCFTSECYQVCKNHDLGIKRVLWNRGMDKKDKNEGMKGFLTGKLTHSDWREDICSSKDYILNGIFLHGLEFDDNYKDSEDINKLIKQRDFGNIDLGRYLLALPDSIFGILEYKRHLLQHLVDHFKKEMEMKNKEEAQAAKGKSIATVQKVKDILDVDEIELFGSNKLPCVEPAMLRVIFETRLKIFESVVSLYEAAVNDKRDLPTGWTN